MDEVWEKSQTVDPEVRAYIYSLVNAVGGSSTYDDTYQYDEKLNRFDVKRCLAEANLVKGDLLEILALWPEEAQTQTLKSKLALACLQLLVPLTWPAELDDDKTTVNHHRHLPYLQLAQVGYKRAVLHYEHAKILRTAVRIALPSMVQPRRERSKRDEGIVKLVLYFFRNMAMITQPQMLPAQGDENEVSRSATIDAFSEQDVFTLMLTMGSGAEDEFQEQDVILLEILFHLLKGVDAKKMFMEQQQMQHEETDELRTLMRKEKDMYKSYNRHASSRHNRFGSMLWVKRDGQKMSTVTGQASIVDGDATLLHMDHSKRWNKPKYRGKQTAPMSEQADFGEKVDLDEIARRRLRGFVEDFLDSGFNPLFSSLRRAIERETPRVATEHSSQDNTFAYVAAVLDQETFVLLNRHMQQAFDEKRWVDLQATLLAFTQILLTVQTMAESKDEDDQEIAENIQNRIFYEEATHDRIVQILRGYTNQGFAYLDAVTECVHVFVRMLERYSKQNADLHIRSKRRARRKSKKPQPGSTTTNTGEHDPGEDPVAANDDDDDEREAFTTISERKFDFARFSAKFLCQPCVNTFLALLHFHADLSPEQLKRCHRYFYRLAFKHDLVVLLFRVDILLLLHRLIKGPGGLSTEMEGFRDWEQLVQQVFRRCIKWIGKEAGEGTAWREMCVVEMLFSKVAGTVYYLQNGFERVVEKRAPRAPAELEFRGLVEEGRRVEVVVSLLLDQGKRDVLGWVKREMRRAADERAAWEEERAARPSATEELEEGATPPAAPSIFLSPDSDERKLQLFKDKHLGLLLTTLGLERLGLAEDVDASWIFPSELTTDHLKESLEAIQKTEHDPPTFDDGKTAADMLRNKSSARHTFDPADDDDASDSASGPEFPPNLRESHKDQTEDRPAKRRRLTQRNASELTDTQVAERAEERLRREKERNGRIKSALFVEAGFDEESDAEGDREFFRLEEERRGRIAGVNGGMVGRKAAKHGKGEGEKGESGKTRKVGDESEDEDLDVDEDEDEDDPEGDAIDDEIDEWIGRKRKRPAMFEEDSEDEWEVVPKIPAVDRSRAADPDFAFGAPGERLRSEGEGEEEEEEEEEEGGDEATPLTSPMEIEGEIQKPNKEGGVLPLMEVSENLVGGTMKSGAMGSKAVVRDDGDEDEDDVPFARRMATARRSVRAGFIVDSDSE
ncbi:Topoisomerase 1-associated factor 1 [Rachicladosporium monterosium]|uniref:Topoisomerase 1-associated factor 1 n=1 Tax=Rachicladosporium monterosium TaxID=1507873 RepID=A0ABR0L400_9PEZI|nr:Topoisomerase 1-associated factor 1 [Rachicladosporium monterosium]